MGVFRDEDVKQILKMIEPEVFAEDEEEDEEEKEEDEEEDEEEKEEDEEEEAQEKEDEEKEEEETAEVEKEEGLEEGLLQMKLPESVKLQVGWFFSFPNLYSSGVGDTVMRHEPRFVLRQWVAMEVHKGVECCWLGRISLVSKWEMNWRNETMEKSGLRIQAGDDGSWTKSEPLRRGRSQEKSQ